MSSRVGTVLRFVGAHLLRAVWIRLRVRTPLFGFWLASSLTAYSNASPWLALLVGPRSPRAPACATATPA
jgi:hypothetical protein